MKEGELRLRRLKWEMKSEVQGCIGVAKVIYRGNSAELMGKGAYNGITARPWLLLLITEYRRCGDGRWWTNSARQPVRNVRSENRGSSENKKKAFVI